MKKRLAKFVSWVGFSALQGEHRDHEHPVPRYPIRKHELKFHKAAYVGDLDTVEVLLLRKKNVVHSRDEKDRTALHLACTSGQSPVVTLLIGWRCDLNARDKEGKTALIKAVQCQKEVCVSILLEQGADPNLADDFENTALHYAVLAGNTSVAAELLRYNADIEAINKYNLTPFLHAVRKNKEEMVKFLIENGANVHAVDKLQRSALMLAVRHDSPDIVKLLLQKGVNADLLDVHGQSAEQYASSNGFKHLYQLIVDYRARRIPNTPPQNSDLGQSSAKESLPSSHTGAENIQEKLQLSSKDNEEEKDTGAENIQEKLRLSSKDNEEEKVVELGTSNGSCMDPLKNVEQKKISVIKVAPRFEGISVSSISPKHDIADSRPPSDGNLDLAPKKIRHPRFAKLIRAWEEPVINTEAKDGVLKPGTSTFFEDNNTNSENEDAVRNFSQPSTEVSGFSHPAFPAPESLSSSAVLGVSEEEATKPKTGGKENGTRTVNSVVKEQADHNTLISTDGAHKSARGATSALGLEEKEDVKLPWNSESISESELPNRVVHLSGAAGLGEKKTLNGQVESSTGKCPHLKPAVGVKDSVPKKTGAMKNLQRFKSGSSDWVSTSLSLNNEAGQRAKHLKVGKCPLASQSVTTNQSAPTELRQTALVDKDRMNIGAVSLSENAALRGLCESQLPENRSRKEADLDLERTSEEEEERLDGSENNHSQVKEQMNSVDGLDDLTLSPGTASEDSESLLHNSKNTLRPIKRLGPESKDSDRLLKIQDPVDSVRSIELEESDCAVLRGKLKEMENKVNWLHTELLKTREAKSQLKLQNVEWERELCRMRFTLEQEKKKKKDAYTLYEKSKDDLKRKEKQYNEQVDLKQQLESTARALECKLKSVRNKPNQVLEERNDAQRQLSPEQNARVIQDEILAHRLSQQKEAEKANKKMNAEDTMDFELPDPKDSSEVLPQQLLEAERQFRGPEIELHPRRDALRPTTLVLQCVHRDRGQAQRSNKDTDLSQSKQGDVIKYIAKQALLKETICQLQSENTLLRQQLEVARNEARSENTILNTPEPFLDHMGEVEAMSRRVLMLEEGNKELIKECRCLKDRLCQYEMDRAEMEARMRQLQQELADTRKKVSTLEASLEVTAHHQTNSENKRQDGERKPHQTANPNADLPAKEESTSSVLLHLSAETQLLLKEILSVKQMQKKCEALEEEKKKLEEEAVSLRHHLEVNTVGHSQVEQDKRETEEQARRDVVKTVKKLRRAMQYRRETEEQGRQAVLEKLKEISQFLQAQAALQENVLRECRPASVSQTEQRVKDLEPELKNDSNENRLEKYKQLYLEELENRKSLASQLTSAYERLAEVRTKLQLERQRKSSSSGLVPTRPVGEPPSAAGTSAEAKSSPTRRRRFRTSSEPSTNLSDPLFRMRKELENNVARELKEATAEPES